MRALALDTALDHCQAAVVEGDEGHIIGASTAPAAGDAEAIVTHADAALASACIGVSDISRIVVTVGPGSFTGVRVGIAYARGLAFALGATAVGVSTLAVMARQIAAPCLVCVDARHGAVYAALYANPEDAPDFTERVAIADAIAASDDSGATLAGTPAAIEALGRGQTIDMLDPAAMVRVAAGREAMIPPRALYLAGADAVSQRHKTLARA